MITSNRRAAFFALTSLAIVAAAMVTFRSAAYAQNADVLAWAFTFDLTLTVPFMYYALVVRRGVSPITIVPVFVICAAVARGIVPHDQQQFLHQLRWVVAPLELAVLWMVARRLLRTGRTGNGLVDRIVASELGILRYGLISWRQQDRPGFTVHRRNDWGTIVAGFTLAIVAESIGVHLFLQQWSPIAAWVVTGLDAYGILWLFGDYHALRLRPTTIEDGVLHLRYGMRWEADIDIANIAAIQATPPDWKRKGVLKIAILDEPNLLIEFHEPVIARGLMGITRTINAIAILPDEPERFETALRLQM